MKKQIGIWLDYKEAHIITLNGKQNDINIISSEIESYHLKGGARSKTPYGPMDKTSESKFLARKKHQVEKYYKKIMEATNDANEILIMGPAEAKIGLRDKMTKTRTYRPMIKGYKTVDSITKNQKVARTLEFFGYSSTPTA